MTDTFIMLYVKQSEFIVFFIVLKNSTMISLLDIYEVVKNTIRPLREGEQYFKSGLLMCVGVKERKSDRIQCLGLAAQTSGILDYPHEVECNVDTSKPEGQRIADIKCKCPAGNSGQCKHSVALLLYLNRLDEEDLDDLSCTDLEQQWGSIKATHYKTYEAKRLCDLCHVKCQSGPTVQVTEAMRARWRQKLLECAPLSEYSLFYSGVRMSYTTPCSEEDANSRQAEVSLTIFKVLTFKSWSLIGYLVQLTTDLYKASEQACQLFYENKVQVPIEACVKIGVQLNQGSSEWLKERCLRITGSICYGFYTYYFNKNPDWGKKYRSVYKNSFTGNADTIHGLRCEPLARDKYIEKTNSEVIETGLLIRPELPWAGFSPDVIIMNQTREPTKILEIKCPKEGKRLTCEELIALNAIKAIDANNNDELKKKHPYYGQIQLGMMLLGVEKADLIIYSSVENNYVCVNVSFDADFAFEMASTLCVIYFQQLLPRMVQT